MKTDLDHSILICTSCKGTRAAKDMRAALAARLPKGFALRPVDCMAGCARPIAVGLQGCGKAQYLFGEIQDQADFEALAIFAQQFLNSDTGWSCASERPVRLYEKTLARLPALVREGGR